MNGRDTCFSREELALLRQNRIDSERRRIAAERRRVLG